MGIEHTQSTPPSGGGSIRHPRSRRCSATTTSTAPRLPSSCPVQLRRAFNPAFLHGVHGPRPPPTPPPRLLPARPPELAPSFATLASGLVPSSARITDCRNATGFVSLYRDVTASSQITSGLLHDCCFNLREACLSFRCSDGTRRTYCTVVLSSHPEKVTMARPAFGLQWSSEQSREPSGMGCKLKSGPFVLQ